MEIWKDIPGYEGYYQASNQGQVRSVARRVLARNGKHHHIRRRVLKPNGRLRPGKYLSVSLLKDGVQLQKSVHRLVWISFRGPIPKGKEPNHKDGIKSNNRLRNLELVTHSGNMLHAYRNGLIPDRTGERNSNSKLTQEKAEQIRRRYSEELAKPTKVGGLRKRGHRGTKQKIAAEFGVSADTVKAIVGRERWL